MKSHDTIVIGANKKKEILFFKSFDYSTQKEDAQAAFTHAMTYDIWYISALDMNAWKLVPKKDPDETWDDVEENTLTFKIPKN